MSSHSNGRLVGQTPGDVCGDAADGEEPLARYRFYRINTNNFFRLFFAAKRQIQHPKCTWWCFWGCWWWGAAWLTKSFGGWARRAPLDRATRYGLLSTFFAIAILFDEWYMMQPDTKMRVPNVLSNTTWCKTIQGQAVQQGSGASPNYQNQQGKILMYSVIWLLYLARQDPVSLSNVKSPW